jgi:hypothetical protein
MADKTAFDRAMTSVKVWMGAIGANGDAEDIKSAAIVAQKRIDMALRSSTLFQGNNSRSYQKLVDASGYLGKIVEHIEAGEKIVKDFEAVQQIYSAISVLKDDDILIEHPDQAAAAFDMLFMGFGSLAKKLPPPFDSTVGELLLQCGSMKFFSNMNHVMFGPNSNMGRAMRARDGNY